MNKLIIFIAALMLFSSCVNKDKVEQERIKEFEAFLGKEKVEVLDKAVIEFEKFILDNTVAEDLDSAYVEILRYLRDNPNSYDSLVIDWETYDKTVEQMKAVGLWKEIWIKPSKMYFENGEIKYECEYKSDTSSQSEIVQSGSIIYPDIENLDIDSLISESKEVRDFYYYGEYFQALEKVKQNDTTLINYLENVQAVGTSSSHMIAHAFLYYKLDYTSYFIRRILAIELYY